MGYVDVSKLACVLPDGRVLFDDVSFRLGDGAKTALVGANGTGKTTLPRMIAGDLAPASGTVARTGGVGVMRQFIGSMRDDSSVRDLLVELAPPAVRVYEAGEPVWDEGRVACALRGTAPPRCPSSPPFRPPQRSGSVAGCCAAR